jgi:orotidine-5'-phosphate decarboxylase
VGHHTGGATPADAVAAGSDFLVVGRPIVQADNPEQAALQILEQMNALHK